MFAELKGDAGYHTNYRSVEIELEQKIHLICNYRFVATAAAYVQSRKE
jgi:hypothetical protein